MNINISALCNNCLQDTALHVQVVNPNFKGIAFYTSSKLSKVTSKDTVHGVYLIGHSEMLTYTFHEKVKLQATHTVRKEPFWLFKKTQRKISKNTLWRANLLALSGEPIKWLFKKGQIGTLPSRYWKVDSNAFR